MSASSDQRKVLQRHPVETVSSDHSDSFDARNSYCVLHYCVFEDISHRADQDRYPYILQQLPLHTLRSTFHDHKFSSLIITTCLVGFACHIHRFETHEVERCNPKIQTGLCPGQILDPKGRLPNVTWTQCLDGLVLDAVWGDMFPNSAPAIKYSTFSNTSSRLPNEQQPPRSVSEHMSSDNSGIFNHSIHSEACAETELKNSSPVSYNGPSEYH